MAIERVGFWRLTAVLVAVSLAIYGRTLFGGLLSWDDIQHFKFNLWMRDWDILHFWREEYYGLYVPLTYTIWTFVYKLSGESPVALHAMNLALHAANGVLIFAIARRRLDTQTAAFFAALIFICHPFQVESIAWISAGRDLLSAFFGLLAIYLLQREAPARASICFVLGLLCKPALAPLPLAWLCLERKSLKPVWATAWFVVAAAALIATYKIQRPFSVTRVEPVAFYLRPLIAADALGFYIRQFILPYPQSADYARQPNAIIAAQAFWPYLALFVVAAAAAWRWFRKPELAFTLIMLFPVMGFAPFAAQAQSTVFDRYMYLPMVGVALALAPLAARYVRLSLAILLVWATLSFLRAGVWDSNRALFADILEHNPQNYFAQVNYANEELADGLLASAETHLQEARHIDPRLALAPANLANVYWKKNDPAAILQEFKPLLTDRDFLTYNFHEPQAVALLYRMVARSLAVLRHTDEARLDYRAALAVSPHDEEIRHEYELFEKENAPAGP